MITLLCLAGEPVFALCQEETCPSIVQINATENSDAVFDTRITFINGGFCNRTKEIRMLSVTDDNGDLLYSCSNLTSSVNQPCEDNDMFVVEQQQPPCSNIAYCKYNIKLIKKNISSSDKGLYNVIVNFNNFGRVRGEVMQQFHLTLLNKATTNSKH